MLVATLAVLALSVGATTAAAKTPCWRQVINDWVDDENIDGTYPLHCYGDAIKHIPVDLRQYSSIVEDIQSARQQVVRGRQNLRRPTSLKPGQGGGAESPLRNPNQAELSGDPPRGLFKETFDKVGPRNADSIPLPLIILAGLALLLIAAGGAGLVSRRLRARKIPG